MKFFPIIKTSSPSKSRRGSIGLEANVQNSKHINKRVSIAASRGVTPRRNIGIKLFPNGTHSKIQKVLEENNEDDANQQQVTKERVILYYLIFSLS